MYFPIFFKYFIINPSRMRILFILILIIYGSIISITSFYILSLHQTKATKLKLIEKQKQSFDAKAKELKMEIQNFVDELNSLKNSSIFKSYLENGRLNDNVNDLFSVIINANPDLFQLRFIDSSGLEKIRYDRESIGSKPVKIDLSKLQNKFSRDYFQETKKVSKDTIWFSKLDLNIEYGKIQKPIVPTIRIATPIYLDSKFMGIVIMNIFFEDIIESFVNTPLFNISIYDKDGNFIYHKHKTSGGKIVDYSWSKYLKKDYNFNNYLKNIENLFYDKYIKDYIFAETISDIIPNEDRLRVYFEPELLKMEEYEKDENRYILTVMLIVLLLSFPVAFIISIIPNILNKELFKTKRLLEQEVNVVDEYVCLLVMDKKGKILNISKAYERLTGYKKSELIGHTHKELKDPNSNPLVYKNLWETILSKNIWEGELKNIKKDGTPFFIKNHIKPNLNLKGEISSFTSYVQDITYQKKIEDISITDELTKLYNRREFNIVFDNLIANSKRYKHPFSMIILDIDYFKQFNDTYGHPKGDFALVEVAKAIKKSALRDTDRCFRIGGEEFAVLFSANKKEDAFNFAQKLRQNVENLKIEHKNSKVSRYLTISIGVFFTDELKNSKSEDIYRVCDKALYESKQNGRNQVFLAKVKALNGSF